MKENNDAVLCNLLLFVNTTLCLLTLLFMFLEMDAVNHQRLNKLNLTIEKQYFSQGKDHYCGHK